jgi:peptide deformylase
MFGVVRLLDGLSGRPSISVKSPHSVFAILPANAPRNDTQDGARGECESCHTAARCKRPTARFKSFDMALLNILRYPDPRLHTVARPVEAVDARIRQLVDDMIETMYAADGVGLAATQVDVHERVIVIDVSEARNAPVVLINPELVALSDEMVLGDEGCLSVPAVYDKVPRRARVTVRALDRAGVSREIEADGLLAVCVQHEMDHLVGKVFVEYLSPLKRERIRTKLLKKARDEARSA